MAECDSGEKMSFKDFSGEDPGTFGWDYMLGGNTTGLFPDETYTEIDGDPVTQVTYTHTGGGKYEPSHIDTYVINPDSKEPDKG